MPFLDWLAAGCACVQVKPQVSTHTSSNAAAYAQWRDVLSKVEKSTSVTYGHVGQEQSNIMLLMMFFSVSLLQCGAGEEVYTIERWKHWLHRISWIKVNQVIAVGSFQEEQKIYIPGKILMSFIVHSPFSSLPTLNKELHLICHVQTDYSRILFPLWSVCSPKWTPALSDKCSNIVRPLSNSSVLNCSISPLVIGGGSTQREPAQTQTCSQESTQTLYLLDFPCLWCFCSSEPPHRLISCTDTA